jgi:ribokinase
VGGTSLDVLHLGGQTVETVGGAGLYTALAARRAGLEVTMLAPRARPMPAELAPVAELVDWRGRAVEPSRLPHFEIGYSAEGRREVRALSWGAEAELDPEVIAAEAAPGLVYVVPLTDPGLQLAMLRRLREAGRWVACGTYPAAVGAQPDIVRQVFQEADAFFCNEEEAEGLFGDVELASTGTGRLLFVTRGRHGALVFQGSHATEVPPVESTEVDPTGAGDAFCGATLAGLAEGLHPVRAARRGVAMAATVVAQIGPGALLAQGKLGSPVGRRVRLDEARIGTIASWLAASSHVRPFDFCGPPFPRAGDPWALDFFFSQTAQQFGFWRTSGGRYSAPMVARFDGRELKGSDYLWAVWARWQSEDQRGLAPSALAALERSEFERRMESDDGVNPLPAAELHWRLARAYGQDLEALGVDPAALVGRANQADRPVAALLGLLDHVGGYKEDPLRKKSALLALVLQQRPEGFLRRVEGDEVPPIVDYHIQRTCLRTGLVVVDDEALARRLERREALSEVDEEVVREASYRAVGEVRRLSGKSMAAVDWFFFQNRRRCPEMVEPDCPRCEIEAVCARRTRLFQPVRRTTFY